jgi:O-antigen/teichoic acid export membrane protein
VRRDREGASASAGDDPIPCAACNEADVNSLAGSLKLRLSAAIAAQTYNQAITIGAQLISVPVLISAWGVEQYGVWLLISALPAYLALADLGFAQVGGNDMTMRLARGDRDGALISYQTTFAMNCILGLAGFAVMASFALSPLSRALISEAHTTPAIQWAIVALAVHVLISLLRGVIGTGLRAVGMYSLLVLLGATMRLMDAAIVLAIATLGGGILDAALGMLAGASISILAIVLWFQRRHPWLKLGFGHASRTSALEMLPSSLHFVGYTLGNLISIQGATIVVGAVLGPAAVALTSTARTLARVGPTAANMISQPLLIEYAALFGDGATKPFRRLFRWHALAISAISALYLVLMLLLGPLVYSTWTHGKFGTPQLLLGLLTIAMFGEMLWTALQTPSIAVNRMRITGRAFFVASCLGLVALGLLSGEFGVIVFGWVAIALSAAMLVAATVEIRALIPRLRN